MEVSGPASYFGGRVSGTHWEGEQVGMRARMNMTAKRNIPYLQRCQSSCTTGGRRLPCTMRVQCPWGMVWIDLHRHLHFCPVLPLHSLEQSSLPYPVCTRCHKSHQHQITKAQIFYAAWWVFVCTGYSVKSTLTSLWIQTRVTVKTIVMLVTTVCDIH
jgi:hypothetical protein